MVFCDNLKLNMVECNEDGIDVKCYVKVDIVKLEVIMVLVSYLVLVVGELL